MQKNNYTHQEVDILLAQLHTMMFEFMHSGKECIYADLCKSIGFTPLDEWNCEEPEPNDPLPICDLGD